MILVLIWHIVRDRPGLSYDLMVFYLMEPLREVNCILHDYHNKVKYRSLNIQKLNHLLNYSFPPLRLRQQFLAAAFLMSATMSAAANTLPTSSVDATCQMLSAVHETLFL